MNRFTGFLSALFALVLGVAGNAMAAVDLSTFTIDVTPVETLAGIVLTAGAALWVIRKLIKTENRS